MEYKVETLEKSNLEGRLNALSRQGWKLIQVQYIGGMNAHGTLLVQYTIVMERKSREESLMELMIPCEGVSMTEPMP